MYIENFILKINDIQHKNKIIFVNIVIKQKIPLNIYNFNNNIELLKILLYSNNYIVKYILLCIILENISIVL